MGTLEAALVWNCLLATGMVIVVMGLSLMLKARPAIRHALWMLVLLKLVTPPMLPVPVLSPEEIVVVPDVLAIPDALPVDPSVKASDALSDMQVDGAPAIEEPPSESAASLTVSVVDRSDVRVSGVSHWSTILFGVSVAGSLLIVVSWLVRGWRFRRLVRSADQADEDVRQLAADVARAMGVANIPDLRVVAANVPPLLWAGSWRPVIVLPLDLLTRLSRTQLSVVIAHELAHCVRHDRWGSLLASLVSAALWWNPVAWFARRQLRQAQEECCDALVVSQGVVTRRTYAETLLAVIDSVRPTVVAVPVMSPGIASASLLRRRFEVLGQKTVVPQMSWAAKLVVAGLLVCLPCVPTRSAAEPLERVALLQTPAGNEAETAPPPATNETADRPTENSDDATANADEAAEMFEQAIQALADNFARIKTAEVTYETLIISPSVERRQTRTGFSTNGKATITWTETPANITRHVLTLADDNLRCEGYQRIGNEWNHSYSRVRQGDLWTTYFRERRWAQQKHTEDLGSWMAVDPRYFGGLDQRYGLLEQMRRSGALSVKRRDGLIHLVAEIVNAPQGGYRNGQQYTYTLDPNRNLLPTRVLGHWDDGTLRVVTELSYEEVQPGTWFVGETSRKFFLRDKAAQQPEARSWNQVIMRRAVGDIVINQPIDDDFQIDIPSDVVIMR